MAHLVIFPEISLVKLAWFLDVAMGVAADLGLWVMVHPHL